MNIKIKITDLEIRCTVKNTQTGKKIYSSLPENNIGLEKNAKEVFNLGEIAFWNQGNAIAIGFGPTPVSLGSEIRLISSANHWADAKKPTELKKLEAFKNGEIVEVLKD